MSHKKHQTYYCDKLSTYYVVFTDSAHPIYSLLLKKHFGHVYIITHDRYNWICNNPRMLFLQTTILPYTINQCAWKAITKPTDHVIKIQFYPRDNIRAHSLIGWIINHRTIRARHI